MLAEHSAEAKGNNFIKLNFMLFYILFTKLKPNFSTKIRADTFYG